MKGDTVSSAGMGGEEVLSQAEMEVTEHKLQAGKCQYHCHQPFESCHGCLPCQQRRAPALSCLHTARHPLTALFSALVWF